MIIIILVEIMHSFEWHWKTMANFEFIIMRLHDSVKCISSKFKCLAGKLWAKKSWLAVKSTQCYCYCCSYCSNIGQCAIQAKLAARHTINLDLIISTIIISIAVNCVQPFAVNCTFAHLLFVGVQLSAITVCGEQKCVEIGFQLRESFNVRTLLHRNVTVLPDFPLFIHQLTKPRCSKMI